MSDVKVAQSDADIARCFAVMHQLRPHLKNEAEFIRLCRQQMAEDHFSLIYVEDGGAVAAVAGFRIQNFLHSGKTLYVDDLVTAEDKRSKGFGETLLAWMENHARGQGCLVKPYRVEDLVRSLEVVEELHRLGRASGPIPRGFHFLSNRPNAIIDYPHG